MKIGHKGNGLDMLVFVHVGAVVCIVLVHGQKMAILGAVAALLAASGEHLLKSICGFAVETVLVHYFTYQSKRARILFIIRHGGGGRSRRQPILHQTSQITDRRDTDGVADRSGGRLHQRSRFLTGEYVDKIGKFLGQHTGVGETATSTGPYRPRTAWARLLYPFCVISRSTLRSCSNLSSSSWTESGRAVRFIRARYSGERISPTVSNLGAVVGAV